MNVSCPVCGWVKPLHPLQEMTTCPCGWRMGDVIPLPFPVQLELTVETTLVLITSRSTA